MFFEAKQSDEVIGGLAMQSRAVSAEGGTSRIGAIGLVCVDERYRGAGVARELISAVIGYAREHRFAALVLWTNQHHVYERHGFRVSDPWLYGNVHFEASQGYANRCNILGNPFVIENSTLPVPPFAQSVHQFSLDDVEIIFLADGRGVIVASFQGDAGRIADALAGHFPSQFRLNVVDSDPLRAMLASRGAQLDLAPANLQMWLPLNNKADVAQLSRQMVIPILERI